MRWIRRGLLTKWVHDVKKFVDANSNPFWVCLQLQIQSSHPQVRHYCIVIYIVRLRSLLGLYSVHVDRCSNTVVVITCSVVCVLVWMCVYMQAMYDVWHECIVIPMAWGCVCTGEEMEQIEMELLMNTAELYYGHFHAACDGKVWHYCIVIFSSTGVHAVGWPLRASLCARGGNVLCVYVDI